MSNPSASTLTVNLPHLVLDTATQTLTTLRHLLDKAAESAESRHFDAKVLLETRLAPDMFPFTRQVQIACDTVKNGVARLAGVTAPRFEDREQTLDELRERIDKTLAYVAEFSADQLAGDETRAISFPIGRDRSMSLSATDYAQRWMLPNLYFHLTTAYNLLRHNGVAIGKRDFLGQVERH